MPRIADLKIWVRLTAAIWVVLALIWAGAIVWTTQVNRETAIRQAQDFSQSIHEMTMAGLTGMMITGTVGQREVFLDQIKQLSVIKDLEVIRGEGVSRQYGPGNRPIPQLDADEREALERRAEVLRVERDPVAGEYLRVVMPALASENYLGKNCIACHQVPAGTPLGLVSMKVSLDKVNAAVDTFMWKSIVSALVVSLPLIAFVLWLMAAMGGLWWLYVWAFWLGFNLLVMLVYPTFIAPLFNTFQPLADGPLKARIEGLMTRCGFRLSGLFVMDGSKRSAHGNAYFTGFGASKRIVFFDTLLAKLDPPEVEAVLAHELGHYHHHHHLLLFLFLFLLMMELLERLMVLF